MNGSGPGGDVVGLGEGNWVCGALFLDMTPEVAVLGRVGVLRDAAV